MFEVYIHVPFCMRRCGYCDFNTYTASDLGAGASRVNYATMARREMALVKQWQLEHGVAEPPAATVFFGGGTPTILPAADLVRMLDGIRETWGVEDGAEITTEANPDTVDADYIRELADGGFTRISFGMQSAVPHVLETLDRTHTPANVAAGVEAANAAGLRSSVDLIYGAPGESLDDWRTSLKTAIDLGVDHISAYALTVEPTTKMGRQIAAGTLPKPDDDDEAAKYDIADEMLSAAGLQWYEVSNWARPGYESRHNLGYWRNVDWAGLGPGAHSHVNAADGRNFGVNDSGDLDDSRNAGVFRATGRNDDGLPGIPVGAAPRNEPDGDAVETAQGNAHAVAGLRSWDIAHPKRWATAINAGRLPWADSETIDMTEDFEERLMLGLRIRDGFDMAQTEGIVPPRTWDNFVHDGLLTVENGRAIPTRRGRLLNDAIITDLMEYL
ncbi:radical SAM family heme chaperone HemW [Bifidobacterium choloepi]|uniref:Heme chaperone HemW n=1 Tax=Bifidobacterium choloepi TaxID=2614131 RepID=A0A6I5N0K6_9BIFI|nr:coproporphyrinogen III oxidase [Bifidobacterium choloepi]